MRKSIGEAKTKAIIGATLLVGVIIITAIATTINNTEPTAETSVAVKDSDTKKPTNDRNNNPAAENTRTEPKGASQSSETKNTNQQPSNTNQHSAANKRDDKTSTANDTANQSTTSKDSQNTTSTNATTNQSNQNVEAEARSQEEAMHQEELARLHAEPVTWQGTNTYQWRDDCPTDTYTTTAPIGGYPICECTSYVAWKVFEKYGFVLSSWGNANSWDVTAAAHNYKVDNTPTANSIGQIKNSGYGHVFWVEAVNSDGSIITTEYNDSLATYLYSGTYHWRDFGSRIISAQEATSLRYIHLDQHA